jgi:hypothetical protein
MSANNTFLAVFLGSKTNSRMTAWNALPEAERLAKQKEGTHPQQARGNVGGGTRFLC